MKYENKKTGAVIESNSKLGGNWRPIEPKKETAPKKKGTAKK